MVYVLRTASVKTVKIPGHPLLLPPRLVLSRLGHVVPLP